MAPAPPTEALAATPGALVAARFRRLADLLEIEGANPFRVRAYRRAAVTAERLGPRLRELLARATGRLRRLDETETRLPPGLAQLLALPGLGPKRIRRLHGELGIRGPGDLRAALDAGAVRRLRGFGPALEQRLRAGLATRRADGWPSATAAPHARSLHAALEAMPGVMAATIAGSLRRGRPIVGDIDLVVAAESPGDITQRFTALPGVAEVLTCGETQATVRLTNGLQADLRIAAPDAFGAMLIHFTGSKAHNIALRRRAQARGLKLNEYGLYRGRRRLAGRTEAEIYAALGLAEIPPARREAEGEIEAAERPPRPRLDRHQGGVALAGPH
ncbi:nucleotidyltransferase domain-containing protein [uncultured Phenylobacterium sp.]|uniref:type-X family DNA polymerase n=1 Tax=uncultured Phenylobacterium sp. TaxID=349273 RepID=UPI0025D12832|nr:nucleotidyltransferase domain-containing protein [uncultured Phenylobacterium sp.]